MEVCVWRDGEIKKHILFKMYTFALHLEIAGGRKWKARIGRWRKSGRKSGLSLDEALLKYAEQKGSNLKERDALFNWYRNAHMDYGVRRDTRLEHRLYAGHGLPRKSRNSRKRARRIARQKYGLTREEMRRLNVEVDHIDCNPLNNDPANLQLMRPAEHRRKRCRSRKRRGLRVPTNVSSPAKWKTAYEDIKRKLAGKSWARRHTVKLVDAYKAAGGRFD